MAERNGIRSAPARSNRRESNTGLPATLMSLCRGVTIPALSASLIAISSQVSILYSSVSLGNFAIERWPCWSITDAFGRAPPSEEPGAKINRRSSSVSSSRKIRPVISSSSAPSQRASFGRAGQYGLQNQPFFDLTVFRFRRTRLGNAALESACPTRSVEMSAICPKASSKPSA